MPSQEISLWTPVWTDRLILRRPGSLDREAAVVIHTDPRTNVHHPEPEMVTPNSSASRFDAMCEHWDEHGFGIWVVATQDAPQRVIGFTGLSYRQIHDRKVLNLYYRYDPAAWGQGYAAEGAGRAVQAADDLLPSLPILAYTSPDNIGSQKTALAAGLARREDLDVDNGAYIDVYFAYGW